jgi:hypothetical protein
MSDLTKIDYDSENEVVIAYPSETLSNCIIFNKAFAKLYPNEYIGCISGILISNTEDNTYWARQGIFVLNDKHIQAINSVGIDAITCIGVHFSVIPKEMLWYIDKPDNSTSLGYNVDRFILKKLMEKHCMTQNDYREMTREAIKDFFYNYNKIKYLK